MVTAVDADGLYRSINFHSSNILVNICVNVPLLHLHSECGVYTVVEVQVSGAVIGPVCNSQVTVSDTAVQLLLYRVLLQDTGIHYMRSSLIFLLTVSKN